MTVRSTKKPMAYQYKTYYGENEQAFTPEEDKIPKNRYVASLSFFQIVLYIFPSRQFRRKSTYSPVVEDKSSFKEYDQSDFQTCDDETDFFAEQNGSSRRRFNVDAVIEPPAFIKSHESPEQRSPSFYDDDATTRKNGMASQQPEQTRLSDDMKYLTSSPAYSGEEQRRRRSSQLTDRPTVVIDPSPIADTHSNFPEFVDDDIEFRSPARAPRKPSLSSLLSYERDVVSGIGRCSVTDTGLVSRRRRVRWATVTKRPAALTAVKGADSCRIR